ncbi:hypothetical protein [Rubrivirga sp. IMCC45206]|uniref:hypothetical protein n=1 Tax=Rubrivirga sp. IMCC45206 TaxID=3391614 RepID=UPI00398FB162
MKPPAVAAALEEALRQLSVRVRRERGTFRGGLCVVDDAPVVVLNKLHPPQAQVAVLARALREHGGVDQLYLRPAVRAALEDAWAQADAGVPEETGDDDV